MNNTEERIYEIHAQQDTGATGLHEIKLTIYQENDVLSVIKTLLDNRWEITAAREVG